MSAYCDATYMTVYCRTFRKLADMYRARVLGLLLKSPMVIVEIRSFGSGDDDPCPARVREELEQILWPSCISPERLLEEVQGPPELLEFFLAFWQAQQRGRPLVTARSEFLRFVLVDNEAADALPGDRSWRLLTMVESVSSRRARELEHMVQNMAMDCILDGILQPTPAVVKAQAWCEDPTAIPDCFDELSIPWEGEAIIDHAWPHRSVLLPITELVAVLQEVREGGGPILDILIYDRKFAWTLVADHEIRYTLFAH